MDEVVVVLRHNGHEGLAAGLADFDAMVNLGPIRREYMALLRRDVSVGADVLQHLGRSDLADFMQHRFTDAQRRWLVTAPPDDEEAA